MPQKAANHLNRRQTATQRPGRLSRDDRTHSLVALSNLKLRRSDRLAPSSSSEALFSSPCEAYFSSPCASIPLEVGRPQVPPVQPPESAKARRPQPVSAPGCSYCLLDYCTFSSPVFTASCSSRGKIKLFHCLERKWRLQETKNSSEFLKFKSAGVI